MPKVKTSKDEVLQKVIETIRRKGIANSSMSDLAKQCAIQKSHFYYYFDSKETLIKEVLATVNSYMSYNLNKTLDDTTLSITEKLKRINRLIHKLFLQYDGGCVMANTALESAHANPKYFEEIRFFFEQFIDGMRQLLSEKHSPARAQYLAEQIVQDLEGGILLMRIYKDPKYLKNAMRRMSNLILH
ncbi:TetR/AcrR family transcriptional regulator [Flavobacteriaceae bacterium TP-CH-4]|uniref:TetR/AcrR family transcriptional regulator n=1 Tax=Pelagihabitans pacificus TaxID=2696054 RepID=A0A967ATQ3_9FLAO|nr:TetR/AcrR family transcriptional regulator [Pelagihabitans pacificus]NHF59240.1 TetR/AcrR family transcriptional regulator [Pelagihabitans pacificus]